MCLTVVYDEFTPFYFAGIDTGTASSASLKREDHQQDAASPRWWPWPAAWRPGSLASCCVCWLFIYVTVFSLAQVFFKSFFPFFSCPPKRYHTHF